MSRRTLSFVLLLSLGVNVGVVAAVAAGWFAARPATETGEVSAPQEPVGERRGEPSAGDLPAHLPDGGVGGRPIDGPPPFGRLADRLALVGESRRRFVAIQEAAFTRLQASRRERRRLVEALHAELASEQPDPAEVDRLIDRLGVADAAGERAIATAILETRGLLDPEQQQQYLRFLRHLHDLAEGPRGRAEAFHARGRDLHRPLRRP